MMKQANASNKKIIIKDSTLREGLDVAGVNLTIDQKLKITRLLDQAKVPEVEVVAPGKVFKDFEFAKRLKEEQLQTKTSGLVYAYHQRYQEEIVEISRCLDRFDLLMPVSSKRKPYNRSSKINQLLKRMLRRRLSKYQN